MRPAGGPVRVLVVDDSPLFRELLRRMISADPGFDVVGVAGNGQEAAELARTHRPNVITMDLQMPGADGYEGIAEVMATTPTPILVLSGDGSGETSYRAFSLGALDLLEKPSPAEDLERYGARLRTRLKLLAGVRVIRHPRGVRTTPARREPAPRAQRVELVALGASLGGPRALAALLHGLPQSFPAPIVAVQHIADGFTPGLVKWLDGECELEVREAKEGDALLPGRVLFAPGDRHLELRAGTVTLTDSAEVDGFRPSVTRLFQSAAERYGARVLGVILTGMGQDGARGMKALHEKGALTIAQDEASCAVFGMPKAAIDAGAVTRVLPVDEIARALIEATS